jgi:hypothetical protein
MRPNLQKLDDILSKLKTGTKEEIISACESLIMEDEFFQWEGAPNIRNVRQANKAYFMDNGGIQLVIDMINKSTDDQVKRFGIDVLWAYSETDENRRELLYGGALPVIINCLKDSCPKVQEGAVGALWQLLEYEPIQVKSLEEGLLEPLLHLLGESKVTRTQTRAAGCLHLISWNENCRTALIEGNAIDKILIIECSAIMVNYFRLLALANMVLLPEHQSLVEADTLAKGFQQVMTFVTTEAPESVRSIEDRLMYIWVSMKPYVPLVFSPTKELFLLGMFALANLTYKEGNRKLMVEEELFDKVTCMSWVKLPEAENFSKIIYKNMFTTTKTPTPPTLYSIVFNHLNNHFRT